MKSHWRDRSVYAASGASSAPNSGKKERSAWLPRSSGTNSCAGTRKSKVKIFGKEAATSWRTAIRKSANEGKIRRSNSRDSHGLQCKEFLMSFLLAHCGGGQDQPGCLGPSAKRPGSVSRELKRNAVPSERSEFESILDSTLGGNSQPSKSRIARQFKRFGALNNARARAQKVGGKNSKWLWESKNSKMKSPLKLLPRQTFLVEENPSQSR